MRRADVVDMGVGCEQDKRSALLRPDAIDDGSQRHDAHAAVDHQIGPGCENEKDVCGKDRVDMRLGHAPDPQADLRNPVPRGGAGKRHADGMRFTPICSNLSAYPFSKLSGFAQVSSRSLQGGVQKRWIVGISPHSRRTVDPQGV
ncbi:hypothetical protein AADZ90_005035 [Aestuariibius sp. 2305UL40-4]|uniref:hypothetical protein n=1 Tax=Aestuariibius violaceus TaxID=3234132 RepID=UPI00398E4B99